LPPASASVSAIKNPSSENPPRGMAGAMLMRGTKSKTRQQIQDETDRLKAQINVSGSIDSASATIHTLDANLADTLRFARELLREPSFPATEFDLIRQQRIAAAEAGKTEPNQLSRSKSTATSTHSTHAETSATCPPSDEQIEDLKKVTLDELTSSIPVLRRRRRPNRHQWPVRSRTGQEARHRTLRRLEERRPTTSAFPIPSSRSQPSTAKIETPDKQNALFMAQMPLKIKRRRPRLPGPHHRRHGLWAARPTRASSSAFASKTV